MATIAAAFSAVLGSPAPPRQLPGIIVPSSQPPSHRRFNAAVSSRKLKAVVVSASSSSSRSKNSVLLDLIQDIEPLDVSVIQKDVAPSTVDAMKRTISGMLGLLPSNQFQVLIEAMWESLSKLLISSMMTGYTLRNAEYRLCLERNFDVHKEIVEHQNGEALELDMQKMLNDGNGENQVPDNKASLESQNVTSGSSEQLNDKDFGEMTPEAKRYILFLQSKIASAKKELHEIKRKNAALQMQQFVGEEKNDLLDYLRSLQPDKVAELSEPASPQLKETIHSVAHGLLATLSPKMHSKAQPLSGKNDDGAQNAGKEECAELVENTSVPFQPMISLTRDYLARLLFWSMLLGHYLRGLEYRIELTGLLSLSSNVDDDACGGEQIS